MRMSMLGNFNKYEMFLQWLFRWGGDVEFTIDRIGKHGEDIRDEIIIDITNCTEIQCMILRDRLKDIAEFTDIVEYENCISFVIFID